jgi:hypothetical protein
MDRKFAECGMEDLLQTCKQTPVSRDPNVTFVPLHTSVARKREHGISFSSEALGFVALIFYGKHPTGEDYRSIREFICPKDGRTYVRKKKDIHPASESDMMTLQ